MVKFERATSLADGLKTVFAWLVLCLLVLLIGVFLLVAVGSLIGAASYLGYIATSATVFDTWGVLSIIAALMSVTAIAGAGFALWRRKPVLALGFAVLVTPIHFIIEGSRCDTSATCGLMGWAALPADAFAWKIRLRPVMEANEAEAIASAALSQAGSDDSPFQTKRLGDHWIVSTIDQDGAPGAHAVRIDTRSAEARLVACPADQIRCGMERPIVSDGRRVFRNDGLGLAAIFPTSRSVCISRGKDDKALGFFAMVRAPDTPCDIIDSSRQMGLEVARSRMKGCMPLATPALPWRSLSREAAKLFRSPRPSLGGRPSVVCELHQSDQIQISVYASVPAGSTAKRSPDTLYEGYIVTTPAHLAEDIQSFETFLESARIGPPGVEQADRSSP